MPSNIPEPPTALAELRELLVGQELEDLASVQARLSDPAKRAEDLAQVLPAAIKAAKGKNLRESLEPIIERTLHSSVRDHPEKLVDAIYPIMGPAIRTSIAAAIREFAESMNQILRKSISLRAIKWRIEALITGKSFSEILISRSLNYNVEQVFLIHRQSGLLLQNVAAQGSVVKDADMISGMLTAIKDFLSDSFTEGGQELETVDAGRFKLWLTYGSRVLLVGAVNGTAPADLRKTFRKALDGIEGSFQKEINNFKQDDLSVFEPVRPYLESCLLSQSGFEEGQGKARFWPYWAVPVVILAGFLGYRAWEQARWNRYFTALKNQPGIVVTGVEKHGSSYLITGLKDPAAPDPRGRTWGIPVDARKVSFDLHPFLSMNTSFAALREIEAAKKLVASRIIHFDSGSSKLDPAEADHIEDVTEALKLLPGVSITITGRADETGSPGTNTKLSTERADRVSEALVALGIAPAAIKIVAAGNTQPLRQGSSDWDRQVNRSVSFTVSRK
jgi:outer membrane protein OmpA-like peptidoglycan-associated protein